MTRASVPLHIRVPASKRAAKSVRLRESTIHRSIAAYLDAALPHDAFWTTFPAGGGGKARGGQLKRSGLKAGVPDLMIGYRGVMSFIEIKGPRGKLSPEQRDCHARLDDAGFRVALCRSIVEVDGYLRHYLMIPLRCKVAA